MHEITAIIMERGLKLNAEEETQAGAGFGWDMQKWKEGKKYLYHVFFYQII